MNTTWASAFCLFSVLGIGLMGGRDCFAESSFSWEGDTQEWFVPSPDDYRMLTPKTVGDGAPAEAITDGDYALEIVNLDFGNWHVAARGPGAVPIGGGEWTNVLYTELMANTTLDLDIYVPAGTTTDMDWAQMSIQVEGGGMKFANHVSLKDEGLIHVTWDYSAAAGFNPGATWGQINLILQGDNGAGVSISPIYIDNFVFSGAPEGIPGDFNGDTVVDAADYAVYRNNLGDEVTLPNDNGLGSPISSAHYDLWRSAFGTAMPTPVATASAPEPTALALALLGLGGLTRRRS